MNTITYPTMNQPTEKEIELALDVINRAAKARQASGETDAELALIAECDQLQEAIYPHLLDDLSKELKYLFALYSLMVIAPYAVTKESFKVFRSSSRKAKKLLALRMV